MSNRTLPLDDELYAYLLKVSLREDGVLQALRTTTATLPEARMQIAPEQGQFMTLLLRLMGARRAIEVGVFTGYSSLCISRGLPEDGQLTACDVNPLWTRVAEPFWEAAGVRHKIDLRIAPAQDTLQALLDAGLGGSYDFAFIDADKTGYAGYYEACMALLRPGGLVAVDNTLWGGDVARPAAQDEDTVAIRRFNERLRDDPRIDLSLVPIGDGLTLARKR